MKNLCCLRSNLQQRLQLSLRWVCWLLLLTIYLS
jgi:hypothetical protein